MAKADHSERGFQPRHIPAALSQGMDLFAATWLQQWVEAGGWVQLEQDGKATVGFPDCSPSPEVTQLRAGIPEAVRNRHDAFLDGHHHGKMRGLLSLIEALPCGFDALATHMNSHGLRSYFANIGG